MDEEPSMSSENNPVPETQTAAPAGWRYKLGMVMFILPILSFVAAPIVIPLLGLSGEESAALIGGILVGGELIWLASIPLLGKEGFKRVKDQMFSKLKLTDKPISKTRHSWGLGFIGSSLLFQGLVLIWIVFGFFYLGKGHLSESVGGATFAEEASVLTYALIISAVAFFAGVWLLGGRFVSRLSAALVWHEEE
jgi:hypothetical protein